jgi:hypothetical protein
MKKKMFLILLFLCVFLSCNVYAEEYACSYDFSYSQGIFTKNKSLQFNVNTEDKKITYPDGFFDKPVYFFDYYVDGTYTEEYIVESLNNGCVANVTIGLITFDDVIGYAIFFEESNFYKLNKVPAGYGLPLTFVEEKSILGAISQIMVGEYNETNSTGLIGESSFGCSYYENIVKDLRDLKCKKQDSSCNTVEINQYNDKKQDLSTFCKTILKFGNVNLSPCVNSCLKLSEEISMLEELEFTPGTCGFSERLILWIANIIRWVKYIVPVAVIVLGILDFIKAISAAKEDEMKKAQQRFIRRLIAAALIFIVPFIIEFILNKLGFSANGCGIINL